MLNQDLKTAISGSYQLGYDEYQRQKSFRSISEEFPLGVSSKYVLIYQTSLNLMLKLESNFEAYLSCGFNSSDDDKNKKEFLKVLNQNTELFHRLEKDEEDLDSEDKDELTQMVFDKFKDNLNLISERYYSPYLDDLSNLQ